jgi:hypothetical protein
VPSLAHLEFRLWLPQMAASFISIKCNGAYWHKADVLRAARNVGATHGDLNGLGSLPQQL